MKAPWTALVFLFLVVNLTACGRVQGPPDPTDGSAMEQEAAEEMEAEGSEEMAEEMEEEGGEY